MGMTKRTKLIAGIAGLVAVLIGVFVYAMRPAPQASPAPGAAGADGVTIVAAGDIACDPAYPDFNNGAGTAVGCHEKATAGTVENINPQAVLALGDIQYVHGTLDNYAASYEPTWGRFKNITYPVLGNHEGGEGGTNRAYFDYFGKNAGDRKKGYYSIDLGGWHLIALNSNCGAYAFDGSHDVCAAGSAQDVWLRNDLATHPAMCTLAYFHVPRFSSASDHHSDAASDKTLTTLWNDLYDGGADVILNGHAHDYERFAPLDPAGHIDKARGVREFVIGTGGDDHHSAAAAVHGSEYRNSNSFGVLKLTLHASSYHYQFVNDGTPGATNNDHGTLDCHA